jgi:hypothetical protein
LNVQMNLSATNVRRRNIWLFNVLGED